MVSAGHLGFEGLLGFFPGFLPLLGFFPGFLPLLRFFLAASATTTRSSSRTTKWCHRMMYCGVAVRGM